MALRKCQQFDDNKVKTNPSRVEFGLKIASLRVKAGYPTRPYFCDMARCFVQELCNVENGDRHASDKFLSIIAPVLGVKAGWLIALRDQTEMTHQELLESYQIDKDRLSALEAYLSNVKPHK